MKLSRFLRDRWVALLVAVFALMLCSALLAVLDLRISAIAFIVVVLLIALAFAMAYDFLRRKRFYDRFAAVSRDLDKRYLLTEVIDRPDFLEGELAYDALQGADKDMNDEIARYRRASEEYHTYIETWVHEIKTPIAAAELAVGNEMQNGAVVATSLSQIEAYVEQALYYARGTTLERDYLIREIVLDELVKSAVRAHARTLIDARIKPVFEATDITVLADPKWCGFVLGQLIDNAAKYRKEEDDSNKGAQLAFRAHVEDAGSVGECVVLDVADEGIGMPTSDVSRAFERGFTGENGRRYQRSTGMGLFLCKRLCEKMGLGISLKSTQGIGTVVSIRFPRNEMYLPG